MVLGLLTELDVWMAQTFDSMGLIGHVLRLTVRFAAVMAVFTVWATVSERIARATFFGPDKLEPALGSFASRLFQVFILVVGLVTGLAVLGINLFAVATSFGLVGLGLTFGMQNTVANVVAGISMAMDRPFTVGDRIQVGDFWGEVEEIGLRSVRILTPRREYVIIPNRIMDEREIWNYTIRHPELRVDIPLLVSYESDVDLAEKIALEIAQDHPTVLTFPKPRVQVREFADHGVQLELWVYVRQARERFDVQTELLRKIKRRFQSEGVEIPYPREVDLRYDEDLPERSTYEAPPHEEREREPTILVTTAGEKPARGKASTVLDVAEELGARLIALNVVDRRTDVAEQSAEHAVRPFLEEARRRGIDAEPRVIEGDLEDVVTQLVTTEDVDALVVGATHTWLGRWAGAGVEERLGRRLGIPIITIERDNRIDGQALAVARQQIRDSYGEEAVPD